MRAYEYTHTHINNLSFSLWETRIEDQIKPKASRRQQIIKIQGKLNATARTIQKNFEKINKTDKPFILVRLTKKGEHKLLALEIKEMISPHTWQKLKGLQGNTKYYQQLYVNKLGNLREMEKFLGKYKLSKLTPEKKKNMYTDLQINKYTYLKLSHKEKAQAHMASLMNCTKYLKKKIVYKHCQKTGKTTTQLILRGQYYLDNKAKPAQRKAKQRYHKTKTK